MRIQVIAVTGWCLCSITVADVSVQSLGYAPGYDLTYPFESTRAANGPVVMGNCAKSLGGSVAFRWENGTITTLGVLPGGENSYGGGVSGQGSVVVGGSESTDGHRPFRWTSGTGMTSIGLPNGFNSAGARAASFNGATILVNCYQSATGNERPYRWSAQGGFQPVSTLGGTAVGADISDNGSVVVGRSWTSAGQLRAFRWTSSGAQNLGVLSGHVESRAAAVTSDGSYVAGNCTMPFTFTETVFLWSASTGMLPLDSLGYPSMSVTSIADGASVVAGKAHDGGNEGTAFVWTAAQGMMDAGSYFSGRGIDVSKWQFFSANVSADGQVFTGYGRHEYAVGRYRSEGWIVVVPSPGGVAIPLACLSVRRRRAAIK